MRTHRMLWATYLCALTDINGLPSLTGGFTIIEKMLYDILDIVYVVTLLTPEGQAVPYVEIQVFRPQIGPDWSWEPAIIGCRDVRGERA